MEEQILDLINTKNIFFKMDNILYVFENEYFIPLFIAFPVVDLINETNSMKSILIREKDLKKILLLPNKKPFLISQIVNELNQQ